MRPSRWSPSDVANELRNIGLGKYARDFQESNISGPDLYTVTDADLRTIGMTITARSTFQNFVKSLPVLHNKPAAPHKLKKAAAAPKTEKPLAAKASSTSTRTAVRAAEPKPRAAPPPTYQSPARAAGSSGVSSSRSTSKPAATRTTAAKSRSIARQNDDFDIHELDFQPPPRVNKVPRRAGAVGKRSVFNVPEDGGVDDRVECRYCGRKFASDRIGKHESICGKQKKRPKYNSTKHRVGGTDAAMFARNTKKSAPARTPPKMINGKPKYRVEHENLVAALRAARGMAAYEAGLRKSPPPMPQMQEMPDDRVQCPYCKRRFGEEVARRHIPNCSARYAPPKRGGRTFR